MARGKSIEVTSESEINCVDNCVGACCQNVHLVLSAEERRQLEEAGTRLFAFLPAGQVNGPDDEDVINWSLHSDEFRNMAQTHEDPEMRKVATILAEVTSTMQLGEGYFAMQGRCGNLTPDNICGDYENRPNVCQQFDMGSLACTVLRLNVAERFNAQMQPE